ncbi:TPA: hypothetical protein MX303_004756 [Escherichia coli]|nr:hypothetical protein [Escherichia coli]
MTGTAAQTPVMDVMEIPAEPQVFQSGTQSTGLELVDTYLWIFKHFIEGKELTRSLACQVYIKPYSDRMDSVTAFTFSPSRHDGPGTEVYGRPPGILSAQLSYPAGAPPAVFFPGADFPGTYSFRSYPQNLWITVAPLLREKALLTA